MTELWPARYISDSVLEARVEGLLAEYFSSSPPAAFPIPVELIAENVLELNLSWEPLPVTGQGLTLGGIRLAHRQIVLNEAALPHFQEFPGAERFTIAHEMGHWLLHVREQPPSKPLFRGFVDPQGEWLCGGGARKPRREVQADRFAGVLLLPRSLLAQACAEFDLAEWANLYELSELAGTSISALRIRLEQLNVIQVVTGTIQVVGSLD